MKIFDFNDPRHVQILREEIYRAKRIIREYNESNEWNQMPEEYREWLLSTVDDDMGADFADDYTETDWKDIPDSITNRIDIGNYMLPEPYSKNALATIVDENKAKLGNISVSTANHNVSKVIDFLRTGNPAKYYVYQVLAALFENNVMVNMDDLKAQPGYQGQSVGKDQGMIGQWIQQDRAKGKNYGFD